MYTPLDRYPSLPSSGMGGGVGSGVGVGAGVGAGMGASAGWAEETALSAGWEVPLLWGAGEAVSPGAESSWPQVRAAQMPRATAAPMSSTTKIRTAGRFAREFLLARWACRYRFGHRWSLLFHGSAHKAAFLL